MGGIQREGKLILVANTTLNIIKSSIYYVFSCLFPEMDIFSALSSQIRRHPTFKRVSGYSEPVVTKSHEVFFDLLLFLFIYQFVQLKCCLSIFLVYCLYCDTFLEMVFGNKWQCHMHMGKIKRSLIARHVGYVSNKNGLETWHTPSLSVALMISIIEHFFMFFKAS